MSALKKPSLSCLGEVDPEEDGTPQNPSGRHGQARNRWRATEGGSGHSGWLRLHHGLWHRVPGRTALPPMGGVLRAHWEGTPLRGASRATHATPLVITASLPGEDPHPFGRHEGPMQRRGPARPRSRRSPGSVAQSPDGHSPPSCPRGPTTTAMPASLPLGPEILAGPEAPGARPAHSPQAGLGGPSGPCGLCGLGFQGPQAGRSHQAVLCHL